MKYLKTYESKLWDKISKMKNKIIRKIITKMKNLRIDTYVPENIKINGNYIYYIYQHNYNIEIMSYDKNGNEIYLSSNSDDIGIESLYEIWQEMKYITLKSIIEYSIERDESWINEIVDKNKDRINFGNFYDGDDIIDTHLNHKYVLDDILNTYESQKYLFTEREDMIVWFLDECESNHIKMHVDIKEEFKNIIEARKMGLV